MILVALSAYHGYVLLAAAALAFECILIGFLFPGRVRNNIFSEDFMRSKFAGEHARISDSPIAKGGYPDMGSGRYSDALAYREWFNFNNAQRSHYNFIEVIAFCTLTLIVGGLYFPVIAAATGLVLFIARLIFAIGYSSAGPKGRLVGALLADLCYVILLVISIWSCVKIIKGYNIY